MDLYVKPWVGDPLLQQKNDLWPSHILSNEETQHSGHLLGKFFITIDNTYQNVESRLCLKVVVTRSARK